MAFIQHLLQNNFLASNCPGRSADNGQVRNITEDILNSIAIAQAMFGPDNERNDGYSADSGHVRNITEDILNSIATAQAMFGPDSDKNNQKLNMNSKIHQQRSSVTTDSHKFQANVDVQHFTPEEITVKVNDDNTIIIEAKHEEKPDEHGAIYRHFIRKYVLPDHYDIDRLESKLSNDSVLTLIAPVVTGNLGEQRTIPIIRTGTPVESQINVTQEDKEKLENRDLMDS